MTNLWPQLNFRPCSAIDEEVRIFLTDTGCPIVMEQMTVLIPFFIAGLVVGSLFGVQTLLVLAFAVFVGCGISVVLLGASTGLIWLLVSQVALQLGYLGGMSVRSMLERAGIVIIAPQGRQS
jgi:hypothetical protein